MQDTSLANGAANTDQSIAKIGAMFPTASETHIQQLMKKWVAYFKSIFYGNKQLLDTCKLVHTILLYKLYNN